MSQKYFTVSEAATDCHELMIPHSAMRPSVARTHTATSASSSSFH